LQNQISSLQGNVLRANETADLSHDVQFKIIIIGDTGK
jgi:hypothetical protein